MSLDGLRAWIGEVERKLGARTRVFLVLVAIAIGGAGAGIFLALEADSEGVSAGEVQEQLGSLGTTSTTSTDPALEAKVAGLEVKVRALATEVARLHAESGEPQSGAKEVPEVEAE